MSPEANQGGLVELEQEMQIVRDYLEIEQGRPGARLRYSLDAAGTTRVPPATSQTPVENSIKHAVAPNRAGGEIRVRAAQIDGHLRIEVADTGPGFGSSVMPEGHGLGNLRRRLDVLFGGDAELRISRIDEWMRVSVRVPV